MFARAARSERASRRERAADDRTAMSARGEKATYTSADPTGFGSRFQIPSHWTHWPFLGGTR
jgi:hypothetical protein